MVYEGQLLKNSRGRYESGDGHEYTSGSGIEVEIYDSFDERYNWEWASVEHDGTDYYIVGHKDVKMDGLKVRRRKVK